MTQSLERKQRRFLYLSFDTSPTLNNYETLYQGKARMFTKTLYPIVIARYKYQMSSHSLTLKSTLLSAPSRTINSHKLSQTNTTFTKHTRSATKPSHQPNQNCHATRTPRPLLPLWLRMAPTRSRLDLRRRLSQHQWRRRSARQSRLATHRRGQKASRRRSQSEQRASC